MARAIIMTKNVIILFHEEEGFSKMAGTIRMNRVCTVLSLALNHTTSCRTNFALKFLKEEATEKETTKPSTTSKRREEETREAKKKKKK
jgi:hypothetical protein